MAVQNAFILTPNMIFASLGNMIISQQVFADNIGKHQKLVDKARVDGGLYGDAKYYYATDALVTKKWGADSEATNLLALHRPGDPQVQDIRLDVFRQIELTIDNYLTKQAWSNEGAFASFNSVMLGWLGETKKIYDGTTYNVFIGTQEAVSAKVHSKTWTLTSGKEGQEIAENLADLLVEMGDYSRDFNDYGFLRSYGENGIKVVWNSKYVNKIKKMDLPTLYHKDGLIDNFEEEVLPARYFGNEINETSFATYSATTPAAGKPINATTGAYTPGTNNANGVLRAQEEVEYTVSGTKYHAFAGDELVAGAVVYNPSAAAGSKVLIKCYIEDAKVIGKVLVKLPPYMSAFEVSTSFYNPKSLTENHYLTFGHNTLEYLKNYPMITLRQN